MSYFYTTTIKLRVLLAGTIGCPGPEPAAGLPLSGDCLWSQVLILADLFSTMTDKISYVSISTNANASHQQLKGNDVTLSSPLLMVNSKEYTKSKSDKYKASLDSLDYHAPDSHVHNVE